MRTYALTHLGDAVLLRDLDSWASRERGATSAVLAHIAEADARRLYLPEGYASMFAYCTGRLHYSEEAAFKRIHAARTARRFPALFEAVADQRLHLSAVVLLAPHLTDETFESLVGAAAHKSKAQIEELLAQRSPRPDLPTRLIAVAPEVCHPAAAGTLALDEQHAPGPVAPDETKHAPGRVAVSTPVTKVTPLSPQRFRLQVTITQATRDKLCRAQELLSHQVPSGDVATVLDRALDALIAQVEKRKLARTSKPRTPRSSDDPRHIPAHVKRAVWQRDQGRCTFVGESGQICGSRKFLEFDHVEPVARGGQPTVAGVRLRCRAHNQLEAERVFGEEFMRAKRESTREYATLTRVVVGVGRDVVGAGRDAGG